MSKLLPILAQSTAVDTTSISEIDQEIRDELEFHLSMRAEENLALGMPADIARAAAEQRFGDFQRIYKSCRGVLLGERIMLQRLQVAFIAVLVLVVVALAYQMYSTQTALTQLNAQLAELKVAVQTSSEPATASSPANWEADRPRVVETFPANGATDVDSTTTEIRVTFNKPMADRSWSWVQTSPEEFPEATDEVHYLDDQKTCVMPVKLEAGKKYVIWFNSSKYGNFKDRDGRPAAPHLLTFATRPE